LQDDYLAAMSELIARTGGVKITGAKSLLGFANVKIRQRTRWTSDEYNYSQYHIGKLIAAVGEPHSRELPVYKASITDYQGFTLFFGCYAMRSYQEQSPINNFFPHKNFDSVEMDGGHIEEFYLHIPVSRSYLDSVSRESLAQAENVKVEIVKAYECKK
jgi:hypothetical protein